jgi:CRP-like cAMP-binding protein
MIDPSPFDMHNPLFKGLNQKQLAALDSISTEMTLKPGAYLMKEGEPAFEMYIVIDGSLEVTKHDKEHDLTHIIGVLHHGDTIGEVSFLDQEPRSATVRATKLVKLKKIPFAALEELSEKDAHLYHSLIHHLSQNISRKLRETNITAVEALKHRVEEYKTRIHMGQFLIYVVVILSLIIYSFRFLGYEIKHVENTTVISIPIIVFLTLFVYLMIRSSRLPLEVFGLTLKNWKRSVVEGLLMTLPICALALLVKFLLMEFTSIYGNRPLFDFFSLTSNPDHHDLGYWVLINLSYALFVPVQELMARGSLQGLLERFLTGKGKVLSSIIVSNLIFSTCHAFVSEWMAVVAFIGGLFFGLVYARTHNLIGVIICHVLAGIWALGILGVVIK